MADISIYEAIGRNLKDILAKGTATSSVGSTLISNSLLHPNVNQIKGKSVYMYEGACAGDSRTIINFVPGSNMALIEPNWSSTPNSTSKFLVFNHFEAEDYYNAVNRAMGKAKMIHLLDMVGTTTIVGTQYEYSVPSGMEYISSLRIVPTSGSDYSGDDEVSRVFEFAPRYWRIERNVGGTYLISFDKRKINLSDFDGESVRIQGQCNLTL